MFLKIFLYFYVVFHTFCIIGYFVYRSRIGYMRMFYSALGFFDEIPYVNVVSGMIRSGKTIFLFASSHMMTIRIIRQIQKRMREIERILINVNFAKVIELYNSYDLSHKDKVQAVILNLIQCDDLGNYYFIYDLNNVYFDYLTYKKNIDLLTEYLDLYMHSLRTDYVYSRVRSFNQLTKSYSLHLNPEWEKLKEHNDFPFDQFSIFLDDEKSLESSNIKNNGRSEDDGTDIFLRLFGQIFKELSWFFTSLQNAQRWTRSEREIAQNHIYIKKSYLTGDFPRVKNFIYKLENINQWLYSKVLRFKRNKDYANHNNVFKRISLRLLSFEKYLTSKGFILFDCNIYRDIERVGKDIDPDKQTPENHMEQLLIPVCYTWAIGDTHAYHGIVDILNSRSKMDRDELRRISVDLDHIDFEKILEKYDAKKEKPSSKSDDVRTQIID